MKPITPKEIAKAPSSAAEKEDGVLDNWATSHDEIFDAFHLSLRLYQF